MFRTSTTEFLSVMFASDVTSLVPKSTALAEICREVFAEYGLIVNFASNKTEAMIQFRGRGSDQAQKSQD